MKPHTRPSLPALLPGAQPLAVDARGPGDGDPLWPGRDRRAGRDPAQGPPGGGPIFPAHLTGLYPYFEPDEPIPEEVEFYQVQSFDRQPLPIFQNHPLEPPIVGYLPQGSYVYGFDSWLSVYLRGGQGYVDSNQLIEIERKSAEFNAYALRAFPVWSTHTLDGPMLRLVQPGEYVGRAQPLEGGVCVLYDEGVGFFRFEEVCLSKVPQ